MKLRKGTYNNYRGIRDSIEVLFQDSTIFVGRNDAGKSTLLRGLDLFLNNTEALSDIANTSSDSDTSVITLSFEGPFNNITIDEAITTTFDEELLLDEDGLLTLKKEWDTTQTKIKATTYIRRKTYGDKDFLLLTEAQLIAKCNEYGIPTSKANGDNYNNPEKRRKLRQYYEEQNFESGFTWLVLPTTGSTRAKLIHDQVKAVLPEFEYFRADTALSEGETSIQKYFRGIATEVMKAHGLDALENSVRSALEEVLSNISNKINGVLPESDQVTPSIDFDWTKVIQTGFKSVNEDSSLPMTFRGDGFRRITMMSYFEHLAEEEMDPFRCTIFGFEEPETFLHPKAQEQLHDKIMSLQSNGYQVMVTTHSSIVVSASDISTIAHVKSDGLNYTVNQDIADVKPIADDLGISPDNQFIKLFEKSNLLVLVEGPDDVKAFNYLAEIYADNGKIPHTFLDKRIILVPVGGCDSVMHWINLDIIQELNKPFYAIQDSDKDNFEAVSPTREKLIKLGLIENQDFSVLRKRALENYINHSALIRLIPELVIQYSEFTNMKDLCKQHDQCGALGGKKVVDKHFTSQTIDELQDSFLMPNGQDEFITLFNNICNKLPV